MDCIDAIKTACKNCDELTARKLILSNIERNPDKTAIVRDFGRFRKTYREFLYDVAHLGAVLYSRGLKGKRIATYSRLSYEYVLLIVTALCSDIDIATIDPAFSKEDVEKRLEIIEPSVLFYDSGLGIFTEDDSKIPFEKIASMLEDGVSTAEWANDYIKRDCKNLILFSSGTGGKVKAAQLTAENLCIEKKVQEKLFPSNYFGLLYLPLHHIIGIGELDGYLFLGNTVYLSEGFAHLVKEFQYVKPTIVRMVPAQAEFFSGIMSGKTAEEGRVLVGGNLKSIRTSGAPLSSDIIEVFKNYGIVVGSDYGMTEVAGPVTVCDIEDGYLRTKAGSSGRIIPDMEIRIDYIPGRNYGEILLRSYSVFDGYVGDRESTEKMLRGGWLYTGDLGYVDSDDFLFVVGRKKNLIILSSGENIIPEELEAELNSLDFIAECRVLERDRQLAVDIYPAEGFSEADVRREINAVNRRNPSYRHINLINVLSEPLLRTSTGKIRRD